MYYLASAWKQTVLIHFSEEGLNEVQLKSQDTAKGWRKTAYHSHQSVKLSFADLKTFFDCTQANTANIAYCMPETNEQGSKEIVLI